MNIAATQMTDVPSDAALHLRSQISAFLKSIGVAEFDGTFGFRSYDEEWDLPYQTFQVSGFDTNAAAAAFAFSYVRDRVRPGNILFWRRRPEVEDGAVSFRWAQTTPDKADVMHIGMRFEITDGGGIMVRRPDDKSALEDGLVPVLRGPEFLRIVRAACDEVERKLAEASSVST